jgi:phosphoribosylanthranilate isomerase
MVAPEPEEALALARRIGARRLQLHRVEPAAWPHDFPLPVSFSIPVGEDGQPETALPPRDDLLMLDTADDILPGGTGRTFPWRGAAILAARRAVMLAGGLGPDNVADALTRVRPTASMPPRGWSRRPGSRTTTGWPVRGTRARRP